jgi:hypothetical protein
MKKSATITTLIAGLGAAALITPGTAAANPGHDNPPPPTIVHTTTVVKTTICIFACGVTVTVNAGDFDIFSHNPVKVVTKLSNDVNVAVKTSVRNVNVVVGQVNNTIERETTKLHKRQVAGGKKFRKQLRKAFGK